MMWLLQAWMFVACQSEVDTKPAAEVKDVKEAQGTSPLADKKIVKMPAAGKELPQGAPVQAGLPLSDSSKVEFIGAKVTGDHRGGFKTLKGQAMLDDAGKVTAVNLEIDMASLYAEEFAYSEKFVEHLKDADFFDVATYPTATFKSTQIEGGKVTGIFALHGVEKEITFDAKISDAAPYELSAEFKINRKLWNIEYAGKPDDLIKDDVAIIANLAFVQP